MSVMMWQRALEEAIVQMNQDQVRIPCRLMSQRMGAVAVEAVVDVADCCVGCGVVGVGEAAAEGIRTVG